MDSIAKEHETFTKSSRSDFELRALAAPNSRNPSNINNMEIVGSRFKMPAKPSKQGRKRSNIDASPAVGAKQVKLCARRRRFDSRANFGRVLARHAHDDFAGWKFSRIGAHANAAGVFGAASVDECFRPDTFDGIDSEIEGHAAIWRAA